MDYISTTTEMNSAIIGKCIYCGTTSDLTDEHIIPHGLAGPWKLLKASCKECNKITSKFERDVLKNFLLLARTGLNLPTYHPKNRPIEFEFAVKTGGVKRILKMPASESPTLFMMPSFELPGHISANPQRTTLLITAMSLHGKGDLREFEVKNKLESISYTAKMRTTFAQLLAKIAYGMVVAQKGIDAIDDVYVLPSILGKKDDIGRWVGCENGQKSPELLPRVKFFHTVDLLEVNKEIAAKIRLFASFQTPEYLVIVGRIK